MTRCGSTDETGSPPNPVRLPRWWAAAVCGLLAALVGAPPALADTARDRQWHLRALDIAGAHQFSRGAGVVVAVIDTGVKADHPDLAGNVLPGADLSGAAGTGQRDTVGHGTAMAGLIAAHGHGPGRRGGALGIAPEAKILPIRGSATRTVVPDRIPTAIDQAVRLGADVISLSIGIGPSDVLRAAVEEALAADVVVVAAVGNRPDDVVVGYPAAITGVVAVGATRRDGELAPVSVTGGEVTLTAPGTDIASTSYTGGYRSATGTGDSAAIVAGAAALVRSRFPDLSAHEVVHRLTATADDRGTPGRDPQYGYGALSLIRALTIDMAQARARPIPVTPSPDGSPPATPSPDDGSVTMLDMVNELDEVIGQVSDIERSSPKLILRFAFVVLANKSRTISCGYARTRAPSVSTRSRHLGAGP